MAEIPMALYLFKRILSLGVEHVFGVPGDFNLTLLDYLYQVDGLNWVGTCNELNAAYATDCYTRIKGIPGALVTTYAVGELSAINGVAGAYAEHAGMIHIVGMPSREQQKRRPLLHHTLEPNMDQKTYVDMSSAVRKTHALLDDETTMAEEIDRVLIQCAQSRLPVYIYVPMDTVSVPLDGRRLSLPLDTTVKNTDSQLEDIVLQKIVDHIRKSIRPAILADVLTIRHGGQDLTRKLVQATGFPSYTTMLSKGVISETSPSFNGLYNGSVSYPGIKEALESSDLVINIGPLLSDSNTGGFTREIATDNLIMLAHDFCQIGHDKWEGLHFLPILKRIVDTIVTSPASCGIPKTMRWKKITTPILSHENSGKISQDYLWQRIGRFLKTNDNVIVETGTAQFGMQDAVFPENVSFNTQIFWSSIGYSVGAALGACVAAKEMKSQGRVILIVGDGSLQMTVQEIGSYIRFGYHPIIFVINNSGYSIERAIHGPDQRYNDISTYWDHQKLLDFLGANMKSGIQGSSYACKTIEDIELLFSNDVFASAEHIQVCEVYMDPLDYPWRMRRQLELRGNPSR